MSDARRRRELTSSTGGPAGNSEHATIEHAMAATSNRGDRISARGSRDRVRTDHADGRETAVMVRDRGWNQRGFWGGVEGRLMGFSGLLGVLAGGAGFIWWS